MSGKKTRKVGARHRGVRKANDPVYNEGWSVHIGPLLGQKPEEPSASDSEPQPRAVSKLTGKKTRRGGNTHEGSMKPDDPAYQEGWSVNMLPQSEPNSKEPTSAISIISTAPLQAHKPKAKNSKAKAEASPSTASWASYLQREETALRRRREEAEIRNWFLAGDDDAALTLMRKYLPSHRATADEIKSVDLLDSFYAIRVLAVARARTMNAIIEDLEKGNHASALRRMKKRHNVAEEPFEPSSEESIQ